MEKFWIPSILIVCFMVGVIGCSEKGPGIITPDPNEAWATAEEGDDDIVHTNNVNTPILPIHLKKTGEMGFQVIARLPSADGVLVTLLEIIYRINQGDPHFLADQVLVTIPKWGTSSQDLLVKHFPGTIAEVRLLPMSELNKVTLPT